jgi:8-oxo-dGTP diphosphatase
MFEDDMTQWLTNHDTETFALPLQHQQQQQQPPQKSAPLAEAHPNVRVGVGVLLKRNKRIVAGIRKGSHGAGTLALPGGHLEYGESWSTCGSREVMEEVGVVLDEAHMNLLAVSNDPMPAENKHYITLFMATAIPSDAKLKNLEPHKCEGWREYSWDDIVTANWDGLLFGPLKNLVENEKESLKIKEWINED